MDTATETGDTLAVQIYDEKLMREVPPERLMSKFIGPEITKKVAKGLTVTSPNAVIVQKTELKKTQGDKIIIGFLANLKGPGKKNAEQLWGEEEELVHHSQTVTLNLRRQGVRNRDKMSRKRSKFEFRAETYETLKIWLPGVQDDDVVLALSGLANEVATLTAVAPSTNRKFAGGQTTAGAVSAVTDIASIADETNYLFGTEVVSHMKRMMESAVPRIMPVKTKYGKYFLAFINNLQMKAMRAETAWQQAQREANLRGYDNPIFSGAAGLWDGVVIHVLDNIETRLGAGGTTASEIFESAVAAPSGKSVARALFCGAQAALFAKGEDPTWEEETGDYKRLVGIAVDDIYQVAKTRFDSEDLAVITCDTNIVLDAAA